MDGGEAIEDQGGYRDEANSIIERCVPAGPTLSNDLAKFLSTMEYARLNGRD